MKGQQGMPAQATGSDRPMTPTFALSLSHDEVALLQRTATGWVPLGRVLPDSAALAQDLADLRARARDAAGGDDFTTELVLPDSQILYTSVAAPAGGATADARAAAVALDGTTPYALAELAYDWLRDGDRLRIAAVARETLDEAEDFASAHGFNPVAFVAWPGAGDYPGRPWFGLTARARELVPEGEDVTDPDARPTGPGKAAAPAPVPPRPAAARPDPTRASATAGPAEPGPDQATPGFASIRHGTPAATAPAPRVSPPPAGRATAPTAAPPAGPAGAPGAAAVSPGRTEPAVAPPLRAGSPPGAAGPAGQSTSSPAGRPTSSPAGSPAGPPATGPAATTTAHRPIAPEPPIERPAAAATRPERGAVLAAEARHTSAAGRHTGTGATAPARRLLPAAVALVAVLGLAAFGAVVLDGGSSDGPEQTALITPELATPGSAAVPASADPAFAGQNPGPGIGEISEVGAPREAAAPAAAAAADTGDGAIDPVEAQTAYATTGIWQRAPEQGFVPPDDAIDDLHLTAVDPAVAEQDAVMLPDDLPAADSRPRIPAAPPHPAQKPELGPDGLVVPTAAGSLTTDGVRIYSGPPVILPPTRPATVAQAAVAAEAVTPGTTDDPLAAFKPKGRPQDLVETTEKAVLGGHTLTELAQLRPAPRPLSAQETDAALAAAQAMADSQTQAAQEAADAAAAAAVEQALKDDAVRPAGMPRPSPNPNAIAEAARQAAEAAQQAALAADISSATKNAVPTSPAPRGKPANMAQLTDRVERQSDLTAQREALEKEQAAQAAAEAQAQAQVEAVAAAAAAAAAEAARQQQAEAKAAADLEQQRKAAAAAAVAAAAEADRVQKAEAKAAADLEKQKKAEAAAAAAAAQAAAAEAERQKQAEAKAAAELEKQKKAEAAAAERQRKAAAKAAAAADKATPEELVDDEGDSDSKSKAPAVSRAQRVAPDVPTSASVARTATVKNAVALNKVALIGVYGGSDDRRALIRLPSGKYLKVQVGDKVDGGKVATIGTSDLVYVKSGRNVTLNMPKG